MPEVGVQELESPMTDEAFVEAHRALVVATATKVRRELDLVVPLDDLIQFGFYGLLDARRRFDPTRGAQLSTYAYYRIRGAIIDGVRKMAYLPRRAHARLRALEGGDAALEAIGDSRAADAGARTDRARTAADIDEALGRLTAAYVLSAVGQDEDAAQPENPEERLLGRELSGRIERAVGALPERERALVMGFYFEGRRFDEVAAELGISKSWASRLHTKALGLVKAALEES
jgi:RNA polymerase sigma factor FliA